MARHYRVVCKFCGTVNYGEPIVGSQVCSGCCMLLLHPDLNPTGQKKAAEADAPVNVAFIKFVEAEKMVQDEIAKALGVQQESMARQMAGQAGLGNVSGSPLGSGIGQGIQNVGGPFQPLPPLGGIGGPLKRAVQPWSVAEPTISQMRSRTCPNCKRVTRTIYDGPNFCEKCGAKFIRLACDIPGIVKKTLEKLDRSKYNKEEPVATPLEMDAQARNWNMYWEGKCVSCGMVKFKYPGNHPPKWCPTCAGDLTEVQGIDRSRSRPPFPLSDKEIKAIVEKERRAVQSSSWYQQGEKARQFIEKTVKTTGLVPHWLEVRQHVTGERLNLSDESDVDIHKRLNILDKIKEAGRAAEAPDRFILPRRSKLRLAIWLIKAGALMTAGAGVGLVGRGYFQSLWAAMPF